MATRPLSASTATSFGGKFNHTTKDFHMNPKVSNYQTNGSGRDSYIISDNGGFRRTWENNYKKIYTGK
jgi:hypothetical protein